MITRFSRLRAHQMQIKFVEAHAAKKHPLRVFFFGGPEGFSFVMPRVRAEMASIGRLDWLD
ncbi:hypothetical protein J6TS7_30190 [Paenibacillus dendritiformis]|nr:hypothetical protein J6TS7_30190 [Paenibacillus dendritiformis]